MSDDYNAMTRLACTQSWCKISTPQTKSMITIEIRSTSRHRLLRLAYIYALFLWLSFRWRAYIIIWRSIARVLILITTTCFQLATQGQKTCASFRANFYIYVLTSNIRVICQNRIIETCSNVCHQFDIKAFI